MNYRIEFDSIGSLQIPEDAYYGVQSLRAKNNFPITNKKMHDELIVSMAQIKKAAAITNKNSGLLSEKICNAIIFACNEIINGRFHEQFIVDAIQGGAGTSANMNTNEVIANIAIEFLGYEKGNYKIVHPNDHVNMAQSTNDVFPSAGKLTILKLMPKAIAELKKLYTAFLKKADEFDNILKMGRTQLQDAVPMRLGQSFAAYGEVIKRDIKRLTNIQDEVRYLNMGATAIGTAINVSPYYLDNIVSEISKETGIELYQCLNLIDGTQNLDSFVAVSSALKTCAINLSKISNDLRLLSSGPRTGISEINLPAKQNGSSIMPGKINPVIPEVVSQVAFNIIGHDLTINMAAEAGQLELNAFEPVLFYNIFESIETLAGACKTLTENCVEGITANKERCLELFENSVSLSTALCPYLGYKKSAEIAKTALQTGRKVKDIVLEENLLSKEKLDIILDPYKLTGNSTQSKASAVL